ncbi:MAG: carboxypeptidase-like regulatory domain-containing protein, partial [Gemmatimonadota bacterium]|nr:carboxypeptidase-like regulatory domain-containing protein [Gemmatimonadota bacterium]
MRLPHLSVVVLFGLVGATPELVAQTPLTGRIEGQVTDSLHDRPLAGALVIVTPRAAGDTQFKSVLTDDRGRFSVDSLRPGRYQVEVTHPFLDSLELNLPPREVTVAAGEPARIEFGIPTSATLRAAACPGLSLEKRQGAVVGQVTDADTEKPLRGARVAVSWTDLTLDRATLQAVVKERGGAVVVDSLGFFRLCGVPTDSYLLVQVQDKGRVGSALRMTVPEDVGVALRNLSLSAGAARAVAELDSSASAGSDALPPRRLTGTAGLSGTVRGLGGQPLSGAQVRVLDAAAGAATTDSLGSFTLSNLPAGTQLLEVRRIG